MTFGDESVCRRYLINKRWPDGARCPRCRRAMGLKAARSVFQCPRCGKQLSPTSGTIFHKSRLPLKAWFQAMHWMLTSPEGISALELQKRLHLRSYRAAWLLTHKIRAVMLSGDEALPWGEAKDHWRFIARGRARPGTPHGWSSKYHRAYAAEFAYRARRAPNMRKAFDQLLADCIARTRATLGEIKA